MTKLVTLDKPTTFPMKEKGVMFRDSITLSNLFNIL